MELCGNVHFLPADDRVTGMDLFPLISKAFPSDQPHGPSDCRAYHPLALVTMALHSLGLCPVLLIKGTELLVSAMITALEIIATM